MTSSENLKITLNSTQSEIDKLIESRKHNPDSTEYANNLSICYVKLAKIQKALNDNSGELESYNNVLKIREEMLNLNPDDIENACSLSASYQHVQEIYENLSDHNSANKFLEKLLKLGEDLWQRHPDSNLATMNLVIIYYKMNNNEKLIEILSHMKRKNMKMDTPIMMLCNLLGVK